MNWQDNKLEITVIGLTALTLVGLLGLGSRFHFKTGFKSADINYTMPRPESTNFNQFSLEGREIERSSIAAQLKAKAAQMAAHTAAKANVLAKQTTTASKAQTQNSKKPSVDVRVVEANKRTIDSGTYSMASSVGSAYFRQNALVKAQKELIKNEAEETQDLTEAEWKSLLYTQPTQENFTKLIMALQKGKVTEAFAYNIMAELFKTQQQTTQSNIVAVISKVNSGMAFIFAVHMNAISQDQIATNLASYISSYTSKAKWGSLNKVLLSSDSEATAKALDIISTAYTGLSTLAEYSGRDTSREQQQLTAKDFLVFSNNLKLLSASTTTSFASQASELLSQINSDSKSQIASLTSQTI